MIHPPRFLPGEQVLVLVRIDTRYDFAYDGPLFVPAGTRLIGTWSSEQPADPATHAIVVGETIWHFADDYVSLAPFDAHVLPWEEQASIAQESLKRAQEQERLEQFADAQSLYARALVELEASGKTADELVGLRTKRAFLLEHLDQAAEAVAEFGRVARVYEASAFLPGTGTVDRAYAELAAQALNVMGRTILHHADPRDETWQYKLRQIVDRIRELLPYLSRRYESKVEVLLTSAEILHVLKKHSEARSLFEQADTLYHQKHLGAGQAHQGVTQHLARLKHIFGQTRPQQKPAAPTRKRTRIERRR